MRDLATGIAFHFCLYIHGSVGLCRHEDAVLLDVCWVVHLQPNVAIDARACVPARLFLSIHVDYKAIFPHLINMWGDVVRESRISIHVMSQSMTVQPDGGTMIDSIEVDAKLLALCQLLLIISRQSEVLGIDALSTRQIARRSSHFRVER